MILDPKMQLNHHAYLIQGGVELAGRLGEEIGKKLKIEPRGNPDFFLRKYETLTIDEARALKELHDTRPIHASGKKIFILAMNGMTSEAQNALLKLLEEPHDYAQFFFIVPSLHIVLPTVKSRMQIISGASLPDQNDMNEEAGKFIQSKKGKRLEIIKKLLEDVEKEKREKAEVMDFLNAVEARLHEKGVGRENIKVFEALSLVRTYMNDRAPSLKMLLEYAALNI